MQNPQPQQQQQAPARKPMPPTYFAQTAFKFAFIFMAILNLKYTIAMGMAASIFGMLRMLKTPKFSKQYLQRAILNHHGQNILYLGMGLAGTTNFLYFSPIILYFFYALAQFYNQFYPQVQGQPTTTSTSTLHRYITQIRNNKWYFMQTKSRLQLIYSIYLIVTIPIDFTRILKCLIIGQYNLLRYRMTNQTRHAATNINNYVIDRIKNWGVVYRGYQKGVDLLYTFANQQPAQPQPPQA